MRVVGVILGFLAGFIFATSLFTPTYSKEQPLRIGIYNGSFDPFHLGHLSVVDESLRKFDLDRVVLFPNLARPGKIISPFSDRLAMLKALAQNRSDLWVPSEEALLRLLGSNKNPFDKTICWIFKRFPLGTQFFQIIGSDSYERVLTLPGFIERFRNSNNVKLIVSARPGYKKPRNLQRVEALWVSPSFRHKLSSHVFREDPERHQDWLPDPIQRWVERSRLYDHYDHSFILNLYEEVKSLKFPDFAEKLLYFEQGLKVLDGGNPDRFVSDRNEQNPNCQHRQSRCLIYCRR